MINPDTLKQNTLKAVLTHAASATRLLQGRHGSGGVLGDLHSDGENGVRARRVLVHQRSPHRPVRAPHLRGVTQQSVEYTLCASVT